MFSLRLIFVLFCFNYVHGSQKRLCQSDEECRLKAIIDRFYPQFVAGTAHVERSDPLHMDTIVADLPTIKYSLSDATLTGMKDCEFVKLKNTALELYTIFEYTLLCPLLTLKAQYDLNGDIDSTPVEGKGECKIIYEDYYISFSGKHDKVKDNEGRHHVHILDYKYILDLKQGKVKHVEFTNLSNNDSNNDRVKMLEESTRDLVIGVFMDKYIQNLKNFQHEVPVDD